MRARQVLTITWDQGKEMAEQHHFAKRLGISIYFADARSPWQFCHGNHRKMRTPHKWRIRTGVFKAPAKMRGRKCSDDAGVSGEHHNEHGPYVLYVDAFCCSAAVTALS